MMNFDENTNELASNSLSINIPYEFINKITNLSWEELYYGIKCGFISPEVAIDKAVQLVNQEESDAIMNLASLYKDEVDEVEIYLKELTKSEQFQSKDNTKEKWLYIVLAWLYIHQDQYNILYAEIPYSVENIYEKVNIIWDDFNHPDILKFLFIQTDLSDFERSGGTSDVRYFYESWKDYLQKQKERCENI